MNGVILRFRIMAIWAGVMSLLLWFGYMPAKYLIDSDTFYQSFIWIPILHGFTYPIYLLAALHLAIAQRKSLLSTALSKSSFSFLASSTRFT